MGAQRNTLTEYQKNAVYRELVRISQTLNRPSFKARSNGALAVQIGNTLNFGVSRANIALQRKKLEAATTAVA